MLIHGTAARLGLQDNSVNCIICSPPYFGLRQYDNLEPQIWGGEAGCRHVWETITISVVDNNNGLGGSTLTSGAGPERRNEWHDGKSGKLESATCQLCGAWLGHLGNESDYKMYVSHLVEIGREIRRVLHPTGLFIINIGDSYSSGKMDGLPPKSKMMIPARVAIALQDDGWILRQELPWFKTNGMPESVTDRPGVAHEYIFMFARSERYFWDMEGIKRASKEAGKVVNLGQKSFSKGQANGAGIKSSGNGLSDTYTVLPARNYRTTDPWLTSLDEAISHNLKLSLRLTQDAAQAQAYADYLETMRDAGGLLTGPEGEPVALWTSLKGYSGAHYACFPVALVIDLIKASTSQAGCCPTCGQQWRRVVEKIVRLPSKVLSPKTQAREDNGFHGKNTGLNEPGWRDLPATTIKTIGFQPSCSCPPHIPIASIVCDPFTGSGTVGEACRKLGNRRFIGIDLSAKYLATNAAARSEQATTEAGLEDARQKRPRTDKKVAQAKKDGQLSF